MKCPEFIPELTSLPGAAGAPSRGGTLHVAGDGWVLQGVWASMPLSGSVILGKLLTLPEPQHRHPKDGDEGVGSRRRGAQCRLESSTSSLAQPPWPSAEPSRPSVQPSHPARHTGNRGQRGGSLAQAPQVPRSYLPRYGRGTAGGPF